jgi:hypothetical protein
MPDTSPHYHRFTPETMKGWKSYPARIRGPRLSDCHQAPTLLVHSMERGFVTQNCSDCGNRFPVSLSEFEALGLWVGCPNCNRPMGPEKLQQVIGPTRRAANYAFVCEHCRVFIWLMDLLPGWDEVRVVEQAEF